MKCIMVMFDSLNRHMLPVYGCDWTKAPNFQRLAQRAVTFEKSYVCSMPCMPARRDLHTGRPNFLHRAWGPLEPFDDSVMEMLQKRGVYTHLASDHYHYWEDGGATYHNRYNTWEFFRGQEGDPWKGQVKDPPIPDAVYPRSGRMWRQDWVNRQFICDESQHYQTRTFDAGLDFLDRNRGEDGWFLQIECFDPHEPFYSPQRFKELYPHDYSGPHFDWPGYCKVSEKPDEVEHARYEYAALLSMCDHSLGRVLDAMDRHDLWKDTMLIVWTDHGFHLGERDCWAKVWLGWYEQTAHTPFFVWDPRCAARGERRQALVQPAIDLAPTLLDFFGLEPTKDMLGKPLRQTIERDQRVREAGIFGHFGAAVNVTDGRYVYMRKPVQNNGPLNQYTLFPTVMRGYFAEKMLRTATTRPAFSFTKQIPVTRFTVESVQFPAPDPNHELYDVQADPKQETPLNDPVIERRMIEHMVRLMRECDAPEEQFVRLGLS